MTCRHWRELDDDFNSIYEYCKGVRARCACAGEKTQCSFPEFFDVPADQLDRLRRERAIARGAAAVEPFVR